MGQFDEGFGPMLIGREALRRAGRQRDNDVLFDELDNEIIHNDMYIIQYPCENCLNVVGLFRR